MIKKLFTHCLVGLLLVGSIQAQRREYVPELKKAMEQAKQIYGKEYRFDSYFTKFGKNLDVDLAWETVWLTGGTEFLDFGNCNCIDSMSSSDNTDTQIVEISGTIQSGGQELGVVFTDTLTGQTPKVLNTPLHRINRLENFGSDFLGTVYVYSGGAVTLGVPQVQDSIHLTISGNNNQSFKTAFSVPSNKHFIVDKLVFGVRATGPAAEVDFEIRVKEAGRVFKTKRFGTATSGTGTIPYDLQFLLVPGGSDVLVRAISDVNNAVVNASIIGYFIVEDR